MRTSGRHGQTDTRVSILAILALAIGWAAGSPLRAGQVRLLSVEEMTQRADRIFVGRCIAVSALDETRGGVGVARATFSVERALKGHLGKRISVDVAAPRTREASVPSVALPNAARFSEGERVVLFLYPNSALGLTSAVGLGQGKLAIVRDKNGRDLVLSPMGPVGHDTLLKGLAHKTGELTLDDLSHAVIELARAAGVRR